MAGNRRVNTMAARAASPTAIARICAVLVFALFAAGVGCGEEKGARPAAPPAEGLAPAAPPAATAPLPVLGSATVELTAGRVTVLSNAASRVAMLQQLAEAAGFALELGAIEPRALTVKLQGVEMERALGVVVDDLPYAVYYEFDPKVERHVLARVRVGTARSTAGAAGPQPAATARRDTTALRDRMLERLAEERRRPREERGPEWEAEREELLLRLDTRDAGIRAEVVSEIQADGPGLEILLDVLAGDPDPGVRAAAAEELGGADSFGAVKGLLEGLNDPDPRVVAQVIDALEFAGDETVIPQIRPLLDHRDPAVRKAAQEALEFLE